MLGRQPSVKGMTDRCKNITLPQTSFASSKIPGLVLTFQGKLPHVFSGTTVSVRTGSRVPAARWTWMSARVIRVSTARRASTVPGRISASVTQGGQVGIAGCNKCTVMMSTFFCEEISIIKVKRILSTAYSKQLPFTRCRIQS